MERIILHCDLNNFYATVECLYQPHLRNFPVVVGGDAELRHGIVLAKNNLAKLSNIKTGEPISQALQKCPGLICLKPDFSKYERFSAMAQAIYLRYSSLVQPFGIDECWVDVSQLGDVAVADEIRCAIKAELGVTVSVGVSFSKPFAKLGSDLKKPDAVTRIGRDNYRNLVWPLPVGELVYAGPSTVRRLKRMGIFTIGQLAEAKGDAIAHYLGKPGSALRRVARGEDTEDVEPHGLEHEAKSIGNSATVPRDLTCDADVYQAAVAIGEKVARRLREHGFKAGGVQLGLRDNDLCWHGFECKLDVPTAVSTELIRTAMELYRAYWKWEKNIRSLGICAVRLVPEDKPVQLDLGGVQLKEQRMVLLERSVDDLRRRFGKQVIGRAAMLQERGVTNSAHALKNPFPAPRRALPM